MNCMNAFQRFHTPLSEEEVIEYLQNHPNVVEDFLLTSTSEEFIHSVLTKKQEAECENNEAESAKLKVKRKGRWPTLYTDTGIQAMSRKILGSTNDDEIYERMYEICQLIKLSVNADHFHIFPVENTEEYISLFEPNKGCTRFGPIGKNLTVAGHVAKEKIPLNIKELDGDSRFPQGVGIEEYNHCHVISIPLLLECGSPYVVIQFLRNKNSEPFSIFHFELVNAVMTWIMACLQKMKLNKFLKLQDALNNFLLETTKVMFDDMEDIDQLVTNIMTFTKNLVSADRCALFLVDEDRNELFADYFDEGRKSEAGLPLYTKTSQIRFPKNRGIAGYVAQTGEVVNIKDAYSDDRFNTEIDKKTGYHTKNILCMPINGKYGVIGVVQMINRKNGEFFTCEDVGAFKLFAVYCALALHYSRLYNLLAHQQTKYKVAMEVLHFHLSCTEDEAGKLLENPYLKPEQVPANFDKFVFCCYDYDDILPQLFIKMVEDSFEKDTFEVKKLCRFVLTIRKNYRPVLYHNWHHGFHVAHAIWRIIECSGINFTKLEKMALIVGGICHDVDHRGYNNDFFKKLHLPLANLYTTSVMEQHHYKQTITILHSEGQDIFSFLTSEEHKQVLELIRKYIIATDLALYFPNQKFLTGLIEANEFDVDIPEHRDGLLSLMMTAGDLCAICKPWSTQRKTARLIYEEFYMQGDEEKKRGIQPIPMMDRINEKDIPKMQVGFIGFICKPMYTTLSKLVPATQPLLEGCTVSKENWEKVAAEVAAAAEAESENK